MGRWILVLLSFGPNRLPGSASIATSHEMSMLLHHGHFAHAGTILCFHQTNQKQTLFHRVSRANDRIPRFGISHLRFLIYFTNEQSQIPPCHSKNNSWTFKKKIWHMHSNLPCDNRWNTRKWPTNTSNRKETNQVTTWCDIQRFEILGWRNHQGASKTPPKIGSLTSKFLNALNFCKPPTLTWN